MARDAESPERLVTRSPVLLVGAHGSPYSRKMRAVLRFRRIPFRWILRGSREDTGIPPVPVDLIPVLVLPGEGGGAPQAMVDSTFQIRKLEEMHRERSIRPPDPVLDFLDALIEDYGDEWLTKAMFHYRWAFAPDIFRASRVLPLDARLDLDDEKHAAFTKMFSERQIGRLGVVGSNPTTAPAIEAGYRRLLVCLDRLLRNRPFLFGARPSAGDFGIYGQLTQLVAFDPTSAAIAADVGPRAVAWVSHVEDLGGLEADPAGWLPAADALPALRPLLEEIGRTYAPFLIANAAALDSGAERVECEIDGVAWTQKPFPYQRKCLRALRAAHGALDGSVRRNVDAALAGTGCEILFGKEKP